jgi:hypothetical protein
MRKVEWGCKFLKDLGFGHLECRKCCVLWRRDGAMIKDEEKTGCLVCCPLCN